MDGRIYAVPANGGVDAIWLRQDLIERAGVPLPKAGRSLEDLVRVADRMTVRDRYGHVERYGFLTDFRSFWNAFLPSFGDDIFDARGIRCTVTDPPCAATPRATLNSTPRSSRTEERCDRGTLPNPSGGEGLGVRGPGKAKSRSNDLLPALLFLAPNLIGFLVFTAAPSSSP